MLCDVKQKLWNVMSFHLSKSFGGETIFFE